MVNNKKKIYCQRNCEKTIIIFSMPVAKHLPSMSKRVIVYSRCRIKIFGTNMRIASQHLLTYTFVDALYFDHKSIKPIIFMQIVIIPAIIFIGITFYVYGMISLLQKDKNLSRIKQ